MNLDNLISYACAVVISFAVVGKIDTLQMWIWRAQARVIHESRASNWGSPRFFWSKRPNSSGNVEEESL